MPGYVRITGWKIDIERGAVLEMVAEAQALEAAEREQAMAM